MYYGNIKNFDIANGPGCRVSLFVSGCRNHCVGCFNAQTWDFQFGSQYTKEVEDNIINMCRNENISGLTILGGEPFEPENQRALLSLVKRFKEEVKKSLWMYSGYLFDADMIEGGKVHTEVTDEILANVDVLVDGRFEMGLKNLTIKFRGSTNQRIINVQSSIANKTVILMDEYMK